MHPYVHCSTIYNSQDLEAAQLSTRSPRIPNYDLPSNLLALNVYYLHGLGISSQKTEINIGAGILCCRFTDSQLQLYPSSFYAVILELDPINISPVPDESRLSVAKESPEEARLISPLRKKVKDFKQLILLTKYNKTKYLFLKT